MKRALLQFSGSAILLAGALVFGTAETAWTQAPTSLSYPATNVFIANVSNVYLAPNLAGNAASYTISPALPAGLSFNTNTGVISGTPTAASAATSYTVTAIGTNASQTTSTTTSIQVTNNYFNNNYAVVSFTNTSVINGTTGAAITNLSTPGTGTAAGDVIVYRGVATLSGQAIDCIVKTVSVTSGTTFSAYDQEAPSGSNYSSNDPKFFSPQVSFPSSASGGGSIQYNFQFILGGSYSTTTKTGTNVVLQNVKINTYDIDGNGTSGSNQYNEFGGFTTSEVGSATTLEPAVYNATTGLTTYRSSISSNSPVVTDDPTRARVTYNNISDFSVRVGGAGTAYFFIDFSAGPAFSTAVETDVPSVDLNTGQIGVNNFGTGCGTNMNFTASGQTNITPTTGSNLSRMQVSFPTAEILNGTNERLIVNGATSGGTLALSSDIAATTVALGGVTYNVVSTTASGVRTIVFDKTNFTIAQAEALLDALQYNNNATTPSSGSRNFTVNVRNSAFQSPNAIMTATLNCVSISGNVFHDVNALVDNTVNATGTAGQFTAGSLYVVRVNPTNNQVIDAQPIAAGGAYSFGTVTPGNYNLYVSTTNPTAGTTFTAATFPTNYIATGENLGATAGTDGLTDGKLTVTIGSQNITNANFGLQIPPTTSNSTINNIANPGGFNGYVIPNGTFVTNDADGVIDSIIINSFPTGANYIKIGSTVYTNGGNCPPQSSCVAWPAGGVVVPFASGNPVPAISVDPTQEGTASVVINFSAWDNGRSLSNASNVTLNFIGTSYYNVSGNVWNDANGNGQRGGTENLVAPVDAGQTLYAVLVQENNTYSGAPTILASAAVNATTGYSFTNVPGGNDYTIRIVARTTAPVSGAAATTVPANLATKWTGVSTNANGTITSGLNTNNLGISLPALNATKINQNFGIEQAPDATNVNTTIPAPSVGTLLTLNGTNPSLPVPPATDQEDGTLASGATFTVVSLPQFTTLKYNNANVTVGQRIDNFNPSLLQIQITSSTVGKTGTSFQFNYRDAANVPGPNNATYTITWNTPLPVQMGAFNVTKTGEQVNLNWITYTETQNRGFSVERSENGRDWNTLGFVASAAENGNSNAKLSYSFDDKTPVNGVNYYRLKQTDADGNYAYSEVKKISFTTENTVSVYPNPAVDYVYVNVADWTKVTTVTILDVQGRVLMSSNNASQGISLSGLAKGSYILQVKQSNGQTSSFKFIKS
ncbi:beta strand repeat-containing protein [Edaphocola aurantiacus]|uniref:beta strand repeat-containing protein n=1 Tax=Edaphocola aurantiacus TaxID=2601682 RepID=UPI001C94445A|nr:T9SS type A sorting domain-containing protein [Edaphocola aurantiacus]